MNRRLNCIAAYVPFGRGMIDVGTDHGYLPVALAKRGYPGRLIASDIHEGPLRTAREHAAANGLSERLEFSLCDGLDACDPDSVDSIVIAGMGGDTICDILDRAEWCLDGRYTLILQPMSHAEVLRYWLIHNGFGITAEDLAEENGFLYAILAARFGEPTRLSDAELFTGSADLLRAHPLFPRLREQQKRRFQKALHSLEKTDNPALGARKTLLREMLAELEEMTPHGNHP